MLDFKNVDTSQFWEAKQAMWVRIDLFGFVTSISRLRNDEMSITAQQMPYVVYSTRQTLMYVNMKSRVLELLLCVPLVWRYMSVMCGLSLACELGARPHQKRSAVQADCVKASPFLWHSAHPSSVHLSVIIYGHCDDFGFHIWNSTTPLN